MSVRLNANDVVLVKTSSTNEAVGLIKYVGPMVDHDLMADYVGIELLRPIPNGHNGTIHGFTYFSTSKNYGFHTKVGNVLKKLTSDEIFSKTKNAYRLCQRQLKRIARLESMLNINKHIPRPKITIDSNNSVTSAESYQSMQSMRSVLSINEMSNKYTNPYSRPTTPKNRYNRNNALLNAPSNAPSVSSLTSNESTNAQSMHLSNNPSKLTDATSAMSTTTVTTSMCSVSTHYVSNDESDDSKEETETESTAVTSQRKTTMSKSKSKSKSKHKQKRMRITKKNSNSHSLAHLRRRAQSSIPTETKKELHLQLSVEMHENNPKLLSNPLRIRARSADPLDHIRLHSHSQPHTPQPQTTSPQSHLSAHSAYEYVHPNNSTLLSYIPNMSPRRSYENSNYSPNLVPMNPINYSQAQPSNIVLTQSNTQVYGYNAQSPPMAPMNGNLMIVTNNGYIPYNQYNHGRNSMSQSYITSCSPSHTPQPSPYLNINNEYYHRSNSPNSIPSSPLSVGSQTNPNQNQLYQLMQKQKLNEVAYEPNHIRAQTSK